MLTLVAILGGGLTLQPASAQGVVYLSNTNAVNITSATSGGLGLFIDFTTGNNAGGYTLNSITLLLATNSVGAGETILAYLQVANGGIINSLQGNRANDIIPATGGYNVFTPDSLNGQTSHLDANTAYKINFTAGAQNITFNAGTTGTLPIGVNGWSYGGTEGTLSGTPVFDIIATPVTAVPEPGTLALAGLAGLVVYWLNYFSARRRVE